ncbi:hypothetical protein QUF61_06925 [Candidatus Venteria ishoeyi]|uniref:hypothetical protein n=1 Tax=Candidatus Venteria ishoeyi TaxID=1899563 RepID=UPI0025A683FC|nr:hypothetical protein [Candidatus Venteria ishoeyi]MDM8546211.1 hypothetical protein [Candidatus Venteria ishoeyi]
MSEDKLIHDCLENSLENICQQGCRQVSQVILQMEQGETLPETAMLSATQHQLLLVELKAIMAVYEKTGSCDID